MKRKNSIFQEVPIRKPKRSLFDLSHEVKMSGKFGYLLPMLVMDTLPGDNIRDQVTVFLRAAPMLAPIMHRVDVTTHFFFVPNRLVWDNWEEFITAGQDGTDSPVPPYLTPAGIAAAGGPTPMQKGRLWDYLGLPVLGNPLGAYSAEKISVFPFRAYAKIWNDYYRDPNFNAEIDLDLELDGDVSAQSVASSMMGIKAHMWQKDYFTSALPWAQRGSEVLMPISASGSVSYLDASRVYAQDGTLPVDPRNLVTSGASAILGIRDAAGPPWNPDEFVRIENIDEVTVDNSAVSINDLRRSFAIQSWMENNARGGYRYIEQIESHFNERVPDYRLQRAEYLGGGKQPITISEVLSTADTENVPVGDMAGHGVSVGESNWFNYRCKEHGWIIGIITVTPQTAYQQGLDKMWSRQDKFDYGWPELAHIGEQEILSKEVFMGLEDVDDPDNQTLFGYIPRYSEYKFKNDRVAGDFRDTLSFWHLGRIFTSRPTLDDVFTTMYEDGSGGEETYRRVFAVQDGTDYLWMQLFHRLTAKRPLPYFGVPRNM